MDDKIFSLEFPIGIIVCYTPFVKLEFIALDQLQQLLIYYSDSHD